MKHLAGLFITVSALAVASASAAQNGPPAGARPGASGAPGAMQAPASGEIRGIVRDAASGAPLVGTSIAVRSARDSSLVTGAVDPRRRHLPGGGAASGRAITCA